MTNQSKNSPLAEGRSPLKAAILAVLLESPTYGYDVAQRIDRRMGPSWRVQPKYIYKLIEQLEADGLIRGEEQEISVHPYKRRYFHPTESALRARREWLDAPPTASVFREDIHTRLAFSTFDEIPDLLRALNEYRLDLLSALEGNAATETPRVSWLGTVMSLYRSAVDKRLRAELEWVGEVCQTLKEAWELSGVDGTA